MITQRAVIRGGVQGVGFRWFVTRAAARLGVAGTVRNRPDGAVEVILQADDPSSIDALIEQLREGPPAARVDEVAVAAVEDPPETYRRMRIVQ